MRLTRAIANGRAKVTLGGAPAYVWPGGGITVMVNVLDLPDGAFGYVPTPALVAPLEFTMPRDLYAESGGHLDSIVPVAEVIESYARAARIEPWREANPWPYGRPQ